MAVSSLRAVAVERNKWMQLWGMGAKGIRFRSSMAGIVFQAAREEHMRDHLLTLAASKSNDAGGERSHCCMG